MSSVASSAHEICPFAGRFDSSRGHQHRTRAVVVYTGGVSNRVRQWGIRYRAHNGVRRWAVVVAPAQYGPERPSPPLPLVISPHGRGVRARTNASLWRELPGSGRLRRDLSRRDGKAAAAPLVGLSAGRSTTSRACRRSSAPHARGSASIRNASTRSAEAWADRRRSSSSAVIRGSSPGRSRSTRSPTSSAATTDFAELGRKGTTLQALARVEVGGTPAQQPAGATTCAAPTTGSGEIARSGVPLQVWWSDADEIVTGQENQSGRFFRELRALEPRATLEKVTGSWSHTAESYRRLQLPGAVRWLGLVPDV